MKIFLIILTWSSRRSFFSVFIDPCPLRRCNFLSDKNFDGPEFAIAKIPRMIGNEDRYSGIGQSFSHTRRILNLNSVVEEFSGFL